MAKEYRYETYETPIGKIALISDGSSILTLHIGEGAPQGCLHEEDRLLFKTIEEFNQYCAGQRTCFDIPVDPAGEEDEKEVLEFVSSHVPYGKLTTYESIAERLGLSPERVEEILSSNACPILVPCHRVVRRGGKLGSYVADPALKKKLINFERTRDISFLIAEEE
ncbi:MAG: methylated-DNA--[protein]-cysteine S-methyltransferase [Candidatus Enteromonas sp.]|nr:methylated-DNA--[protein]-cysteine S-methyltransferase [Candidatus Enteromonas sp.]